MKKQIIKVFFIEVIQKMQKTGQRKREDDEKKRRIHKKDTGYLTLSGTPYWLRKIRR